jgi:hypothetical protein
VLQRVRQEQLPQHCAGARRRDAAAVAAVLDTNAIAIFGSSAGA